MIVKTQALAAQELGISTRVFGDWRSKGCPGRRGRYDLNAIRRWRAKNIQPRFQDRAEDPAVTEARVEKLIADSERAKASAMVAITKAQRLSTNVVQLDLVETFLTEYFSEATAILMRIPEEIKGGYPAEWREELAAELKSRITMALQAMHGKALELADVREE